MTSDIQTAREIATLSENVRHLADQVAANRTESREQRSENRERFDRIDERLDRGDMKFDAIAQQASADRALSNLRSKIGDIVMHMFSGSLGAGILYLVSLFFPPKH